MRFPTRKFLALAACAVLLTGIAVSQKNNTPEAMLRAAMDKETVDGDLKAAIEQYKKVIAQKGASKEVVATALVRLGGAYEKQGSAEARPMYERVVREFADQTEAAQDARARLAAIPSKTAGITIRQVCAGDDCIGSGVGSFSPDGRYLTLRRDGNEFVRDLTSGQIRQLTHVPAGTRLSGPTIWAPDSKRVAYTERSGVADAVIDQTIVVNEDGSGTRTVYHGGALYDWSADGKRILTSPSSIPREPRNLIKLIWVAVADGAIQALPTARLNLDMAEVSPDGRYIAFNASKNSDSEENVYVMASDGSGETLISASQDYQEPVGWTSDGRNLLFCEISAQATSLWAAPINGGKPGVPVLVHSFPGRDSVSFGGVTRDGAVYYGTHTNTAATFTASIDPTTGKVTSSPIPLRLQPPGVGGWWSPDGHRIIHQTSVTPTSPGPDTTGLSIYSLDSGREQRVASGIVVMRRTVCWSSDGASILFNRPRGLDSTQSEPVRFNLSNGDVTVLFPGAPSFVMDSCSDGLVVNYDDSRTSIKVRNLKTGSETEIHKYARKQSVGSSPFLSHDGQWVAFREALEDGSVGLFVVSSEGGTVRELTRVKSPAEFMAPRGLAWSPDDRYVYFNRRPDSKSSYEMLRVPAAGGAEESTGLKMPGMRGVEIAPDGKRIVFGVSSQQSELWAMENYLPLPVAKK